MFAMPGLAAAGRAACVHCPAMSRGILLWPDDAASGAVRAIWERLAERGLPSLATHTHRLHRPHVSLVVAEDLPVAATLAAVGVVPARPIPLSIVSAGIFPGGVLYLTCVVTPELLAEQRRVRDLVMPLARDPWPYFEPGGWTPHLTSALELTPAQVAEALPVVLGALPISGWHDLGGLEDGTTGERWPTPGP